MIAHNAAFDFSVMRASFDKYRHAYPDLSYLCSVKIARHVWPHLASHRLNVIAHHLQLRFVHHNAAEDAVVCAAASIAAARAVRVSHIRDLPEKIGMVAGRLTSTGYQPCSMKKRPVARVA